MISAKNIGVNIGARRILDDVCFTAEQGKVTAIVGPNGSGKTTLLRAITDEMPHTGTVAINGTDTAKMTPVDLATARAVLPQSGTVAFPFTVLELVRLGLTAGRAVSDLTSIEHLPHAALKKVGLQGFEGQLIQDLSGGERQRAQLARVLVQVWEPVLDGAPRWLFLDEPVSALDIGHQLVVMNIARDFARAGGGVVAVMHDLNLTSMFADHVTLLHGGRVRVAGAPNVVFNDVDLSACYGCPLRTNTAPPTNAPWILPQSAILTPEAVV